MVVDDDRVSGSITVGRSRLPVWVLYSRLCGETIEELATDYNVAVDDIKGVLRLAYWITECRGEFARLTLTLADVERRAADLEDRDKAWWEVPDERQRVIDQLQRCLKVLTKNCCDEEGGVRIAREDSDEDQAHVRLV